MKILIVGGSGKTGKEIIKQALEKRHEVTALLRNPEKLKIEHSLLTKIKGDVLHPDSLPKAFSGQDAVISALGHKRFFIKSNILSTGTRNMIKIMEELHIKRFICITALGLNDSRYKLGLYYTFFTIPVILWFYFRDKAKQEQLIIESSLDWTIVRPGHFIWGERTGKYKHGKNLGHYILTKMISRANVAHFILKILEEEKYLHQKPGITY